MYNNQASTHGKRIQCESSLSGIAAKLNNQFDQQFHHFDSILVDSSVEQCNTRTHVQVKRLKSAKQCPGSNRC